MDFQINFDENLPVSARRAEIMQAMQDNQVIIVCGETGSGKTTQLPKMALALGRGKANQPQDNKNNPKNKCGHLIGHTQPRRIAASSVAERIAQELNTSPGEVVGYKVRFHDTLQKSASIKLMTDGILLAETQSDPLLLAYDTLIIDEAHERSLNIDFLLGYIKNILPQRPDLKVIITSATIDAERFAEHFKDNQNKPAPIILVSGRTYPVEIRYRPFEEKKDFGINDAIVQAVDELWAGLPRGDILIFLAGEREIRDAADHVRKHLQHHPLMHGVEILPLFSRLSQAEQNRIFQPHGAPRIVLATNVAETSLTVPGIRFVIDTGLARVKRYSLRLRVEQLLVEPISQAAANQRAGRCGRVMDGVCIRLFDESDFAARPAFTDPEILRSSLAAVILRMKALGLGEVRDFAFLQPPTPRVIAEGLDQLLELGAMDERGELQSIGREMARLPLDPRIARMLLASRERGALAQVLVIAAALSVPDVRERPLHAQAQADAAHARFDDEASEFVSYLRLWQWLNAVRGGTIAATHWAPPPTDSVPTPLQAQPQALKGKDKKSSSASHRAAFLPVAQRSTGATAVAAGAASADAGAPHSKTASTPVGLKRHSVSSVSEMAQPSPKQSNDLSGVLADVATQGLEHNLHTHAHKLSQRQWEQTLLSHFISPRRVREWRDIHSQLLALVREHGWTLNTAAPSYTALHLSLVAGLLSNIGYRAPDAQAWLGAHGIRFVPHPGARLRKKPARWIVAAEQVQTTRLFGRGIAAIEPQWLEQLGAHLLKKQMLEPHWSRRHSDVLAAERATLYGIVLYNDRKVSFGRADPAAAREIFIREALVAGNWDTRWPFLAHNHKLVADIQKLEHKSRRQDVLVDEALIYAFYDRHIPEGVFSGATFDAWWCQAQAANPKLLHLVREELMRHEAAGITTDAFPPIVRLGGVDCAASYLHSPGDAADGLSVTVPIFALNPIRAERCEWLVPGMLKEKIAALLKSLPQRPRSRFVPIPEHAARIAVELAAPEHFGTGSLIEVLRQRVRTETGLEVKTADFKLDMIPAHLFMHFRIVDAHGRQIGQGRNLAALQAQFGAQARGAFQALAALKPSSATDASHPTPPRTPQKPKNAEVAPSCAAQAPTSPQSDFCTPRAAAAEHRAPSAPATPSPQLDAQTTYTAWIFGPLPELLELRHGGQTLIGFPALIDEKDAVRIEVFDEPQLAERAHRAGLRRLVALHIRDALKYLEKNIPDLSKMAVAYMNLGTQEDLKNQIIHLAIDRAFLSDPLPQNQTEFEAKIKDGRGRLNLIAQEIAKLSASILSEYAAAQRKLKDAKNASQLNADIADQLQKLITKDFLLQTPWAQLAHFPRYLKAIIARIEKYRADPERDATKMRELQPLQMRFWKEYAARKGQIDPRLIEYRWMLEELRVSFFAQELRTPYPVSSKRLDKVWAQIQS